MAPSYNSDYPSQLKLYISEEKFTEVMTRINEVGTSVWPCCFCFSFGYCCALCTLGLSFLGPRICIKDAEEAVKTEISIINRDLLKGLGLSMELVIKCSTSWVYE